LKISFFLPHLKIGGVERSFFILAKTLEDRGHSVNIITVGKSSYIKNNSFSVPIINLNKRKVSTSIFYLAKYLSKNNIDIVISAQYYANIGILIAQNFSSHKPKIIITERTHLNESLKELNVFKRLILKLLISIFYKNADYIVGNSNSVCKSIISTTKINKKNIKLILNPTFVPEILQKAEEPVIEDWIQSSKEPIILTVGRLSSQKNISLLIDSFSEVLEIKKSKLLIIGDGPQRKILESKVSSMNLSKEIKFIGFSSNPYKYFKYCSVFVLTSKFEGLPNVLIESQALGLPIVTTDSPGGSREVVSDGRSGLLVKNINKKEISKNIIELIDNNDLRIKLIQEGKKSSERFTPDICADNFESLFN
tara:strand:+ start:1686 stop:2783 length:1098 start_codon:yes stop_codon:yes gene_type:complete